jgi:hypothetical protein
MNKLKRLIGVGAALMFWIYPEFVALLVLLWMFWESLGDLTLSIYDDFKLLKTEKALKESLSANVEGYYVHMLTMRSVAARERRSRAALTRKRRIKAVYRATAPASTWVRHQIEAGRTVPLRPATGEE